MTSLCMADSIHSYGTTCLIKQQLVAYTLYGHWKLMRKIKWFSDLKKRKRKMLYPFAQTVDLTYFMDWGFFALLLIILLSRKRKKRRNRTGKYVSSGHLKQSTSIHILFPPAHLLSRSVRNLQALKDSLRFQPFENTPQFHSTWVSFDSVFAF